MTLSRRLAHALLILALAVGPVLGGMHRVLHAHPGHAHVEPAHVGAGAPAHQEDDGTASGHAESWLRALFAVHADAVCLAFDHLGAADAPALATPAWLSLAPPGWLAWHCAAPTPARRAAAFLARAPPATR